MSSYILGLFNAPYFYAPRQIGGPQIFPLNGPQFSLFWEIAVNLFWWSARRVDQRRLAALLYAGCGVLTLIFGIGGDTTDSFVLGIFHVGASFFVGILVFHVPEIFKESRLIWWIFVTLVSLMVFVFILPFELPFAGRMVWKLLLAPLLVLSGSMITLPRLPRQFAVFIGDLSYPIYALHYPIFCWVNGIYQKFAGGRNALLEGPLFVVAAVLFSHAALRHYDMPMRRILSRFLRLRVGRLPAV